MALAVSVIATGMQACKKDNPTGPEPTLSTDAPAEIVFNADGTGGVSVITVTTNQDSWDHTLTPADGWLSASAEGNELTLVAAPGTSEEDVRGQVELRITAGGATPVVIVVKQTEFIAEAAFEVEGLAGVVEVTYTDGSSYEATVEDGVIEVPATDIAAGKVVYSISTEDAGEVLIGRKLDGDALISLKFADGALAFRDADGEGNIPVGTYAEFAMLNDENIFGGEGEARSYIQDADIDLLGAEGLEAAGLVRQNWEPIGHFEIHGLQEQPTEKGFKGIFDGGGFVLGNLYINEESEVRSCGLFGMIDWMATLKNIHVVSGSVMGKNHVGGVVGLIYFDSTVIECSNAASVTGVGGSYNSYNGGVGGIAGNIDSGAVVACYNTGAVSGSKFVGGILGYAYGLSQVVASYNTGEVSGDMNVGGICGRLESAVKACYNTGKVTATSEIVGAIAGQLVYTETTDCYWLAHADGAGYGIGDTEYDIDNNGNNITITPGNTNAEAFSASVWPASTMAGWAIGTGGWNGPWVDWTSGPWSSLGAWSAGGTPDGVNSDFPKLYWE